LTKGNKVIAMSSEPRPEERAALEQCWSSQQAATGPRVDFVSPAWPADWAAPRASARETAQALAQALGWAGWVRLYPKPSLAVVAAARLAKAQGRGSGVLWMAPGTGRPLEPPQGEPGVAVLRGDWAPDAAAMAEAQAQARDQGLLLVADESVTGFRLAAGGAVGAFGLEPDVALFGPALAAGRGFAALAGKGEAPPEPAQAPDDQALAAAAGIIATASQPWVQPRLEELGRLLAVGLDFFRRRTGQEENIAWEGPPAMPRLFGRRLWAFVELAREEGLALGPLALPDPLLEPGEAPGLLWPRLARACARLRVLPEGEKAPLGWRDAAEARGCSQSVFDLE
jgi:hypothetical protein